MARKIILLLSELNPRVESRLYRCPDGTEVPGRQTNEAPVRYLLRAYPDVKKILCVVTPEAEATALPGFRELVDREAPGAALRLVPFRQGEDFSAGPLAEIVSAVDKGDEILLETTGGFRNAVMDLLLLSRVLRYKEIKTVCAVYSNFKTGQVEDVSRLIQLFELVGGMQELTRFGSVRTLRAYYAAQPPEKRDAKIDRLLTAMERLTETITLCRTRQIEGRMEAFNAALAEAADCDDPLMRTLLPVFQGKFGKKLTTPGLIKWCVESDMIQQALTIYKERIPAYILLDRKDLLAVKEGAPQPNMKEYESEEEARFFEHLLKMGVNMRKAYYGYEPDEAGGKRKDYTVTTMEHFEEYLPRSYFIPKCPVAQLRTIAMDYLYIRLLRNMINHANDQATELQRQVMDYLSDYRYKRPTEATVDDIRRALLKALENLRTQPQKGRRPSTTPTKFNDLEGACEKS